MLDNLTIYKLPIYYFTIDNVSLLKARVTASIYININIKINY